MEIFGKNKINVILTKVSKSQNYFKYINIIQYYIQDLIEEAELGIKWIFNLLILADGLTKALLAQSFKRY